MENNNVINILDKLAESFKSVTPFDDNCQEYIATYLQELGFDIQFKKYGDVTNLITEYGREKPVLAYILDILMLYRQVMKNGILILLNLQIKILNYMEEGHLI